MDWLFLVAHSAGDPGHPMLVASMCCLLPALHRCAGAHEVFLSGVSLNLQVAYCSPLFCAQVEAAGEQLEAELDAMLVAATRVWQARDALPALRPVAVHDPVNNAVWLKAVARSPVRRNPPPALCPSYPGLCKFS